MKGLTEELTKFLAEHWAQGKTSNSLTINFGQLLSHEIFSNQISEIKLFKIRKLLEENDSNPKTIVKTDYYYDDYVITIDPQTKEKQGYHIKTVDCMNFNTNRNLDLQFIINSKSQIKPIPSQDKFYSIININHLVYNLGNHLNGILDNKNSEFILQINYPISNHEIDRIVSIAEELV